MKKRRRLRGVSPKIWVDIVDEISRGAHDALTKIEKSIDIITDILDRILAFGTSIDAYSLGGSKLFNGLASLSEAASRPAIGVDSSMSKPVRIGHTYYAVVDSALVHYPSAAARDPEEEIWADLAIAPDAAEPAYAKNEINLKMLEMELEALRAANLRVKGRTVVFLDGPLIDPPAVPADEGLRASYEEYLRERARQVRRLVSQGADVIGVVKRVTGSLTASALIRSLAEDQATRRHAEFLRKQKIGDYSLALYTSLILRKLVLNRAWGSQELTIVLRAFPVNPESIPAATYFAEEGLTIYTFLMVPRVPGVGTESKPLRIEIAVPGGEGGDTVQESVARAAAAIAAWLVPGTNLPRPVLMAHTRCTIRDKDSRRILREMLTHSMLHVAKHAISHPEILAPLF